MKLSTPFVVSSGDQTLAAGATAVTDTGLLQAPYRRAYYIHEIRFQTIVSNKANSQGTFTAQLGGSVSARIYLGKFALTNQFVPIWNFDAACPPMAEGPMAETTYTTSGFPGVSHYRWRFSKPLLVPAGQVVQCELKRSASTALDGFTGSSCLVSVTYVCSFADPNMKYPSYISAPYATCWSDTSAVTDVGYSDELSLKNQFTVPFFVTKMVGRLCVAANGSIFGTVGAGIYTDDWLGYGPTVKIWDSFGYDVARDYLPFNEIFSVPYRVLPYKSVLAPGEVIKVSTANKTSGLSLVKAATGVVPQVSLVGYRSIATRGM